MTNDKMSDHATSIVVSLWPEANPRRSVAASAIRVDVPDHRTMEVSLEVPFIDGALLEVVPGDPIPARVSVCVNSSMVLEVTATVRLGIVYGSPSVVRLSGAIRTTAVAPGASSLPWGWSSDPVA